MPRVGIALGSNLGDRLSNLRAARECLRRIATAGEPLLAAPIYQSEPMLCPPDSPQFYNTVVEIAYEGDPASLLSTTRALELELGRTPIAERNAPRVIDIDLLYFGECLLHTEALELPHPRIGERRFVLQPLADIRPDLVIPGQQRTVSMMLETLADDEPPLVAVPGSDDHGVAD
jgi:2-amino-4-hydroxy-6-hydroxymethyldihydropteridine diphosphokinase